MCISDKAAANMNDTCGYKPTIIMKEYVVTAYSSKQYVHEYVLQYNTCSDFVHGLQKYLNKCVWKLVTSEIWLHLTLVFIADEYFQWPHLSPNNLNCYAKRTEKSSKNVWRQMEKLKISTSTPRYDR